MTTETPPTENRPMRYCFVYLKAGQVIKLRGRGFSAKFGRLEGDLRELAWEELDMDYADPLWLDVGAVASVVVCDEP